MIWRRLNEMAGIRHRSDKVLKEQDDLFGGGDDEGGDDEGGDCDQHDAEEQPGVRVREYGDRGQVQGHDLQSEDDGGEQSLDGYWWAGADGHWRCWRM